MHGYLLSAVAPRPIAFASTVDSDGNDFLEEAIVENDAVGLYEPPAGADE